ncbi:hypothetical protein [Streptomyces sp. NPDC056883]|uniref:hypothetical protein n=1 Tax=Streptomyces sp. NPDC056883 TaxID=3345959 RepID=UPI00367F7CB9
MLTDRDERNLLTAAENRIAEPLRAGAALAAVRRLLRRERARERESVTCHTTAAPQTSSGSTRDPRRQPTAPLPR